MNRKLLAGIVIGFVLGPFVAWASNVQDWSTTDASNNSAAPAGAPEGMAPSAVNDTMRAMMGGVARMYAELGGAITSGGSSNAYTLTTSSSHSTLATGDIFRFEANHTNTGAATMTVDSSATDSIVMPDGDALAAGAIQSGGIYTLVFDGTNFQLTDSPFGDIARTDGNIIVGDGTDWVAESGSTARASLGANSASNLTTGTLADARVAESNVTQHEAALAINSSQVTSDFKNDNSSFSVNSADAGDVIEVDSASTVTITVGSNALGGAGKVAVFLRRGAGTVTFSASGTTIRTKSGNSITVRHGAAALIQLSSTEFQLVGDV